MAKPQKTVRTHASGSDGDEEVAVSVFKDNCLQLIDRVGQTREQIVITKYGRPVARLVPFDSSAPNLFGSLEGSVTIHGDLVEPIDEEWDAER